MLTNIIRDTPIWAWLLFTFLIARGINALHDREMGIGHLFLLPVVFLVFALYSVINETSHTTLALLLMGTGLLVGCFVGWGLWRSQPRLRNTPESSLIIRTGTPLTLIMIILTFVIKFIITAILSIHTALLSSLPFNLLFGFISGFLDGIFWGGTLNLFMPWYRNKTRNRKAAGFP